MSDRKPPEGKGDDFQADYTGKAEPYWFRWADQWWVLPHPNMLDFSTHLKVVSIDVSALAGSDADDADLEETAKAKVDELFALIMDAEQAADWKNVESRPLNMMLGLFNRWMEHSQADPGESSASDDSSRSTGRPSKPTSTGSTASGSRRRSTAKKAAPKRVKAASPPANS